MARLQKKTIAAALGVTPGRVSQLAAAGMPTTSIAEAQRWKDANIAPRLTSTPTAAKQAQHPVLLDSLDAQLYHMLAAGRGHAIGHIRAALAGRGVELTLADAAAAFAAVAAAVATLLEASGEPDSALWELAGEPPAVILELAEAHAAALLSDWTGTEIRT